MDNTETKRTVSFYVIIAFYEKLLNEQKITKKQYDTACHSLAEELHCTGCIF